MEKLVEREAAPRNPLATAPALAVQFFLIPLGVIAVAVAVYAGFRMMVADARTPQDYLAEVRSGGSNRRWPAAYELSRLMADRKVRASDPGLADALVQAFENSKTDDPRVRRYLALAIGRLDPPLPANARQALLDALGDPDSETTIDVIWALGATGDPTVVPRVQEMYASADPGIRKISVYALGALPGDAQLVTLRAALNDPTPDVQWNAAVALARHHSHEAVPVLKRMLDRPYVETAVKPVVSQDENTDPAGDVMISSLRAVAALKEQSLLEPVTEISQRDRSLRVREAALETLKALKSA
jgi:HEAT repeat protein